MLYETFQIQILSRHLEINSYRKFRSARICDQIRDTGFYSFGKT